MRIINTYLSLKKTIFCYLKDWIKNKEYSTVTSANVIMVKNRVSKICEAIKAIKQVRNYSLQKRESVKELLSFVLEMNVSRWEGRQ
jgi:dihydroxyacid dehydratase/phosphogluconate dehydratase